MAKKLKIQEGDLFAIPLLNEEFGIGQIVAFPRTKDVFIMVVFDYKTTNPSPNEIVSYLSSPILFLGYSTDARLYHKKWHIIANDRSNLKDIELPYNRLGTPPEDIYLTDYKNERIKTITQFEFDKLQYMTSYAPIRFESALNAYFELSDWKSEDYDSILYSKTLNSIEVAKEILNNGLI